MVDVDIEKLESNAIIHTLVAYYLYNQQEYNTLFKLLQKTK